MDSPELSFDAASAAEHARTTRALLHAPDSEWDAMQLNGCDVLNNFMQQTQSITSSLSASLPPLGGGGAGIAGGSAEGGESKKDAPTSGLLLPADCCGSTAEGSETCPDCSHVRVTKRTGTLSLRMLHLVRVGGLLELPFTSRSPSIPTRSSLDLYSLTHSLVRSLAHLLTCSHAGLLRRLRVQSNTRAVQVRPWYSRFGLYRCHDRGCTRLHHERLRVGNSYGNELPYIIFSALVATRIHTEKY